MLEMMQGFFCSMVLQLGAQLLDPRLSRDMDEVCLLVHRLLRTLRSCTYMQEDVLLRFANPQTLLMDMTHSLL